ERGDDELGVGASRRGRFVTYVQRTIATSVESRTVRSNATRTHIAYVRRPFLARPLACSPRPFAYDCAGDRSADDQLLAGEVAAGGQLLGEWPRVASCSAGQKLTAGGRRGQVLLGWP